jgi:glutamate dehydrogenase
VYRAAAKSIELSPAGEPCSGTDRATFTPAELMRSILRAPVDVLWNGGIGTYVKASTETTPTSVTVPTTPVWVNGGELRCKIVGEGGNLGFTQRGRIEYALAGASSTPTRSTTRRASTAATTRSTSRSCSST